MMYKTTLVGRYWPLVWQIVIISTIQCTVIRRAWTEQRPVPRASSLAVSVGLQRQADWTTQGFATTSALPRATWPIWNEPNWGPIRSMMNVPKVNNFNTRLKRPCLWTLFQSTTLQLEVRMSKFDDKKLRVLSVFDSMSLYYWFWVLIRFGSLLVLSFCFLFCCCCCCSRLSLFLAFHDITFQTKVETCFHFHFLILILFPFFFERSLRRLSVEHGWIVQEPWSRHGQPKLAQLQHLPHDRRGKGFQERRTSLRRDQAQEQRLR